MTWIGVLARVVVGGVWVVAGWLKLGDPSESVRAVRAYDLLPEGIVPLVGHALPVVEIVVGLCLLLGLVTRWAAVASAVLLVAFVVGISSAWARGLSIECGCFGGGGGPAEGASDKYPLELARDVGLLLLTGWLIVRPRTRYALDDRVLPAVLVTTGTDPAATGTGRRAERTRARQQAAEIRRAAAAQEQRRRNTMVSLGVVSALLAAVVLGTAVQSARDTTGVSTAAPDNTVATYALPVGSDSAAVTVDIYEDFMCPYCGQLEALTSDLVSQYAGDDVQFRYHVISFLDRASTNRYSTRAVNALGVVLDTAGPEVAKRFHDELYAQQPPEGSAGLSDATLVDLAVEAGATRSEVQGPIDGLVYEQWVKNGTDDASRAGVSGTPTVVVDGKTLPQQAMQDLATSLDDAITSALGR